MPKQFWVRIKANDRPMLVNCEPEDLQKDGLVQMTRTNKDGSIVDVYLRTNEIISAEENNA